MKIRLFYSYSHKDDAYRTSMETALAQLKRDDILSDWSDRKILPGQSLSEKIKNELEAANIIVFLLSPDFIASDACVEEWEYAKKLSDTKNIYRIPIILRDCSWLDFIGHDDLKALPNDGDAVNGYQQQDTAWLEIYDGIKAVSYDLKSNFEIKNSFLAEFEQTEFISEDEVRLQDIFVFPTLKSYHPSKNNVFLEEDISECNEVLEQNFVLIHGDDMSGKTTLCKHLFLTLIGNDSPALFIDLQEIGNKKPTETLLQNAYENQFEGSYSLWKMQSDKTIILDNLSNAKYSLDFISFALEHFAHIIVSTSSNKFQSYFRDDERLTKFIEVKICNLSHIKQEELIRKRLELTDTLQERMHGKIDIIENQVNSVIINNRLLPRYPFYILSILQTYEGFMPNNLEMTSHGHCYFVLILANLIKSGIQKTDDQINTCFNFSERLANEIYKSKRSKTNFDFDKFVAEYKQTYLIQDSIINRLKSEQYGIITNNGNFKHDYMYFFFLGKFFANNGENNKEVIADITEKSYLRSNSLILLFIIHHSNDANIIDDILLHTMCSFSEIEPAALNSQETNGFNDLVAKLSQNSLSNNGISQERKEERKHRDTNEDLEKNNDLEDDNIDPINSVYKILKNNEILSRILKNKHGSLERKKLSEIIETICDSGLRLVKLFIDQTEIDSFISYLHEQNLNLSSAQVRNAVQRWAFLWTMGNIEKVVSALNNTELNQLIMEVVSDKETAAYDLIGYFSRLDNIESFGEKEKTHLKTLLKKHNDVFITGVLSIRTRQYLKTHKLSTDIEQSVYSLLNIKYQPKLKKHNHSH